MTPRLHESADLRKSLDRFTELCRLANVRVTPQRLAIYKALLRSSDHPDAETLYRRVREEMPTVALDTVYRTLLLLERKKLLFRVGPSGDRARFDGNTEEHHHFVCRSCGLVKDIACEELDAFERPTKTADLDEVEAVHVQLLGLCSNCAQKREEPSQRKTE